MTIVATEANFGPNVPLLLSRAMANSTPQGVAINVATPASGNTFYMVAVRVDWEHFLLTDAQVAFMIGLHNEAAEEPEFVDADLACIDKFFELLGKAQTRADLLNMSSTSVH